MDTLAFTSTREHVVQFSPQQEKHEWEATAIKKKKKWSQLCSHVAFITVHVIISCTSKLTARDNDLCLSNAVSVHVMKYDVC